MAGSFEKQPSPQTAKQSQKQKPAPNTSLVDLIIADYLTQLFAIELLITQMNTITLCAPSIDHFYIFLLQNILTRI